MGEETEHKSKETRETRKRKRKRKKKNTVRTGCWCGCILYFVVFFTFAVCIHSMVFHSLRSVRISFTFGPAHSNRTIDTNVHRYTQWLWQPLCMAHVSWYKFGLVERARAFESLQYLDYYGRVVHAQFLLLGLYVNVERAERAMINGTCNSMGKSVSTRSPRFLYTRVSHATRSGIGWARASEQASEW